MLRLIRAIAPVLALGLLLAACGEKAPNPYDPAATAEALQATAAFSQALESIDQDTACTYYGIEADTVSSSAVYGSTSGAEEIAVITLTDEKAAETALEALKSHVDDQKEALKDYQPDEITKLENAILDQRGNSVLLVVANDGSAAQTAIDGLS